MKTDETDRFLRLERLLQKQYFDANEIYVGGSKERRRAEIAKGKSACSVSQCINVYLLRVRARLVDFNTLTCMYACLCMCALFACVGVFSDIHVNLHSFVFLLI